MASTTAELGEKAAEVVSEKVKIATEKLLRFLAAKYAEQKAKESKSAVKSVGKGVAEKLGGTEPLRETAEAASETLDSVTTALREAGEAAAETIGALKDALREAGEVVSDTVGMLKDALPTKEVGEVAGKAVGAVKEALPKKEGGGGPLQGAGEAVTGTVGTLKGALGGGEGEEMPPKKEAAGEGEEKPPKKEAAGEGEEKPPKKEAAGEGEEKPPKKEAAGEGEEKPPKKEAAGEGEEKPPKKEAAGEREEKPPKKEAREERPSKGGDGRGYLGMTTFPVSLPDRLAEKLGAECGLILLGVEPDGPADGGGLHIGDTLLSLDGHPMRKTEDLRAQLAPGSVGHSLQAKVLRAGEAKTLELEVGAPP